MKAKSSFIASAVAAGALVIIGLSGVACAADAGSIPGSATGDASIRPFTVQVPQAALDDLRRRINATRWPDKETVADPSQGVQLARLQALVRYWGGNYD